MPENETETITGKILESHNRIIADTTGAGKTEAKRLGDLAIDAILGGIGSSEWRKYMINFASTSNQLARLSGDDDFKDEEYGAETLAYIVANSTCTIDTHTTTTTGALDANQGTLNFIKPEMQAKLDAGMNE
jgi:hypothetical protein